jgi:hypothetical protein
VFINLGAAIKGCVDRIAIQRNRKIAKTTEHTTIANGIAWLQLPRLVELDVKRCLIARRTGAAKE